LNVDKAGQDVQYLFMSNPDAINLDEVELRHLRYFLAVAEELHFGHAADRLHMAQPPLSQQIRQLEAWVGYALFTRTSRSVRLTSAGIELQKRLLQTLAKLENDVRATRLIARGQSGAIDVGFIESSILTSLPTLLSRYRLQHPDVLLRLHEFYTSSLIEALRDGRADVGFVRDAGNAAGLTIERVLSEEFVAIVPTTHTLARRESIAIRELKDEPFVLFSQAIGSNAWQKTIGLCEDAGFRPDIVQEAPQWLTILQLVGAGIGVTIAPRCVSQIAIKSVVALELKDVRVRSDIELAFRTAEVCPCTAGFLKLARAAFPTSCQLQA